MSGKIISTDDAPQAIGTYSQAVAVGETVYMSGQVPLDPVTGEMVSDDFEAQANRVFENLKAVAKASGGTLDNAVKLTIFLTDLGNFPTVNEVMAAHMNEPYPARAAVEVSALPKGAKIEIEGVLVLDA